MHVFQLTCIPLARVYHRHLTPARESEHVVSRIPPANIFTSTQSHLNAVAMNVLRVPDAFFRVGEGYACDPLPVQGIFLIDDSDEFHVPPTATCGRAGYGMLATHYGYRYRFTE